MPKTYTPLIDIPGSYKDKCSQVLFNSLQCPRSGDVLVEDGPTSYQLCMAHAKIQQAADKAFEAQEAAKPLDTVEESKPEAVAPKPEEVK